MGNDHMDDEWPQSSRSSWRNSVSPGNAAPSTFPRPHRPIMGPRNQFDHVRSPIEYDKLPYQETFPLHVLHPHDRQQHKAGRRRSRWLIASVSLSLALIATLVLGRLAVARTIPAPSGGGKADASSAGTTTAPASGPFQLVYDGEFNGSSVNQNVWGLYSGTPGGNTATQWVPSTCREEGGMLALPILAQPANGRPLRACGMGNSNTQTYGKYVYRARLDAGHDWYGMFLLWPASGNWPTDGEIDNCEFGAGDVARSQCAMTVHWGSNNTQTRAVATGDFTQWHIFTVIWLPTSITYQIDGQTVWVETQHVPSGAMSPAFQTQGNGDASQLGAYYVDYLHIYRYTGG